MSPEFLELVVDALLPGDEVLPAGSAVGVAAKLASALARGRSTEIQRALEAIAACASGEADFCKAPGAARNSILRQVEKEASPEFHALVCFALTDYYDADAVLTGLGWRTQPPQPRGHALEDFDERLLQRMRQRSPFWRAPD